MKPNDNMLLVPGTDTGSTGIYQLKRLWSKAIAGPDIVNQYPEETGLDNARIYIGKNPTLKVLKIGLSLKLVGILRKIPYNNAMHYSKIKPPIIKILTMMYLHPVTLLFGKNMAM